MKVLITGASGFLGKNIFNALKDKHQVFGLAIDSSDAAILSCDLSDLEKTKQILTKNKISEVDIIIHLASILANENNIDDVTILNQNNILSKNVSILANHLKSKKLINFSSSSVYPNIDGEFTEESEINPSLNPDAIYGLSKFNSEIIINTLTKNTKILVSHLRCVMVYGKGVNPSRIWPVMEKELKEKNTITVFGNGKRLINQIEINTLIKTVNKFVVHDFPGVYNISEETISLKNLAKRIISEKGDSQSKIIEVEKGNTFKFVIDTSKLRRVL